MKFLKDFPGTFYVACTMEVFERMAWYGFFAVSSLYITGSVESGGLGFTSEQRGILQGIIPFLLYMFPVVTGALADKFGYKRTFFTAYSILVPAYFFLGSPSGFWGFFFVFLLVALGAATFKPVVVGTVSHTTSDDTKALGFGIFYMVVNIGGFVGPIVAGVVRNNLGWPWVFNMSAIWIGCNFIILLLLYKEPLSRKQALDKELKEESKQAVSNLMISDVLSQIYAALIRISPAFIVSGFLVGLTPALYVLAGIIIVALAIYLLIIVVPAEVKNLLKKTGNDIVEVLGNPAFFIIVIGTIFTLMLAGGNWITWKNFSIIAAVLILGNLLFDYYLKSNAPGNNKGIWKPAAIGDWKFVLYLLLLSGFWTEFNQIFITMPEYIRDYTNTNDILATLSSLCATFGIEEWHQSLEQLLLQNWQINPEFLVNVDAGAIVVLQVMISAAFSKWKPFTTMIVGTIVTGIAMGIGIYGQYGWIVVASIFVFAIGEMMASPKSQEYVARIAPPSKTAMYMGYYFVSIALGNLFGGILSGQMYGHFGRDTHQPEIMWAIFGIIGLFTAFLLWLYDRLVIKKHS